MKHLRNSSQNYVNKANRKLIGAVCLLLAVKVNDPKETKYSKLIEVKFLK